MLALYIFGVVLGGGFLAVSLLGDLFGGADLDTELDGGLDGDPPGEDSGADTHASKIFSLRTAVYALFGFGAVGTVLHVAGAGAPLAFASALAGGVASAVLVHVGFRYLERTDTGSHPGDASFVGLPGTVTLPLSSMTPGTVAVERGSRRFALRALPHTSSGEDDVGRWNRVVIVDMKDGVARVAPVEEDLSPET